MKKLIISSDTLKPALAKLGHAINPEAVLPVLSNIYCKVSPGQLELIGTNTEITILYKLECEASENFEFLLSYKFLTKIVNFNRHCPLQIESTAKAVKITGPNDVYEIKVSDKLKDFPQLPEVPNIDSLDVSSDLLSALHTALATVGKDDKNGRKFTFVLMEISEDKITIASTDGSYMVFSKEFPAASPLPFQELLLSNNVIKALEGSEEVKLFFSEKAMRFEAGSITIINTRTEEKYVNFRKVFPEDWPGNLTIQRDVLIEALHKCSMVDNALHATKFDLATAEEIKLKADDPALQVNVAVPVKYTGEVKAATVNSEKLLKLLNQVDNDEITMALHDASKAIVLTCKDDEGYRGMIMPIASSN